MKFYNFYFDVFVHTDQRLKGDQTFFAKSSHITMPKLKTSALWLYGRCSTTFQEPKNKNEFLSIYVVFLKWLLHHEVSKSDNKCNFIIYNQNNQF